MSLKMQLNVNECVKCTLPKMSMRTLTFMPLSVGHAWAADRLVPLAGREEIEVPDDDHESFSGFLLNKRSISSDHVSNPSHIGNC